MLLTASSRPITMVSLPLRSNSWLSASTIRRAVSAGAAVATGAAAGAGVKSGAAAATAGAGAGLPRGLPQLEQNNSPTGLLAPQDAQTWLPAFCTAAGAATGAPLARGSPHSSQKREPSGFSWPKEHRTVMILYPPKNNLECLHMCQGWDLSLPRLPGRGQARG